MKKKDRELLKDRLLEIVTIKILHEVAQQEKLENAEDLEQLKSKIVAILKSFLEGIFKEQAELNKKKRKS